MDKEFINKFKGVLKDNLLSIAGYGWNDTEYVIVAGNLDFDLLSSVQNIVLEFNKKTGKFPLFLTEEELTDGRDVFPLEFLNIKLHHEILYGADLFSSLEFDKKYIRRELEFEFRSKLINLRQGYLEVAKSKENMGIIVKRAVPTLLPICNGLLFLKDLDVPGSITEVFGIVSEGYKTDFDVLKKIHEADIGKLNENELKEYIRELIVLLSDLGEKLDEMMM